MKEKDENKPRFYDMLTNKVIDDKVETIWNSREQDNGVKPGVIPKGAVIKDGYVTFPKTQDVTTKEEYFPEKESENNITDINDEPILKNENSSKLPPDIEEILYQEHINYQQKYNEAKEKSHTPEKQTVKRTRKVSYIKANSILAAAFLAGGLFAGITFTNIYNDNKENLYLRENNDYTIQLNSIGQDINHKTNAVDRNKKVIAEIKKLNLPIYSYDFENIVSEFLELPDATFLSNIYNYFQYFVYKNGKDSVPNFDTFILLLSKSVDSQTHPVTQRYLKDCNSWNDFLTKNFSFYLTKDNNNLQEIFENIVRDQAKYNNIYLENYIGNDRSR